MMESSCSSQVSAESSLDFGFAFNNALFSDRNLQVKLMPDSARSKPDSSLCSGNRRNQKHRCRDEDANVHAVVRSNGNTPITDYPATQTNNVRISTVILAAKSPFFYKLFSSGMSEPSVILQIRESEEAAFMDLLKFMYTNTLSNTTPSALLEVMMAADKYEVASCLKYCFQLLLKTPMTCESALLCLNLPPINLIGDTVKPLTDVAKKFFVTRFKDVSMFQEEMLNLPLSAIEVVLSSDDLELGSEDEIYDFIMKWVQRHYTNVGKRREILNKRLLHLIRFQFMSCNKLEELLKCADINPKRSSELIFEALSQHRQVSLVPHEKERAYRLRPVTVTRFYAPNEECIVYLDLKQEDCTRLLPYEEIYSQLFYFSGRAFGLIAAHEKDEHFGLYLDMRGNGSLNVEVEFSRRKPGEEFKVKHRGEHEFVEPQSYGCYDLFNTSWDEFIADHSRYFINGILHLRAVVKNKIKTTVYNFS